MSNKKKHSTRNILFVILSVAIFGILILSGYLGVKINGIYYLMDNTGKKYNLEITQDPNPYTVQINLDSLESNYGKELYKQNGASIVIGRVYKKSIINSESQQYIVQFHSNPNYSSSQGLFVSFLLRNYGDDTSVISSFTQSHAKYKIQYHGKEYDPLLVTSDKGDQFIEYALFNQQAIQDGALRNPNGTITFIVSDLTQYNWTRKQIFYTLTTI